jgi:hypothetical protein
MKTIKILLLAFILGSFFACDEDDFFFDNNRRVTGRGDIESQSVVVDEFSSIDLEGVSNVYIETGSECKVVFTAYANILSYMVADVVGDQLILRFDRDISVNSDEEIRVDITLPELDKVTLSGVGNFYINGTQQNSLDIELNGVGNVEAFGLPVYDGRIELNGTGNVEILAKDNLEVDIDGLGNVYYRGDPDITVDINGLGEVIKD